MGKKKAHFINEVRFLASPVLVERVKGIEPSYSAWEADVLPLNYTRRLKAFLLYPGVVKKSMMDFKKNPLPGWRREK
jgi:hypothetical protein